MEMTYSGPNRSKNDRTRTKLSIELNTRIRFNVRKAKSRLKKSNTWRLQKCQEMQTHETKTIGSIGFETLIYRCFGSIRVIRFVHGLSSIGPHIRILSKQFCKMSTELFKIRKEKKLLSILPKPITNKHLKNQKLLIISKVLHR